MDPSLEASPHALSFRNHERMLAGRRPRSVRRVRVGVGSEVQLYDVIMNRA